MMLTINNMTEAMFENEDARLLIGDVIKNTSATVYYYTGAEITVMSAIKIWNRAMKAEEQKNGRYCSVSFIDSPKSIDKVLNSRELCAV